MRVLVTGAAGQLGATMVRELGRDLEVVALARAQFELTQERAVLAEVSRWRPNVIVNCAAYNAVDLAEDEPVTALEVNALAVRTLARAAASVDARLVHYSTDFVFDGTASLPYAEDDTPNPRSVYAASKLLGEWFARDAPRHYVLRVESLFGGPNGNSSVDKIVGAILEGRDVRVFVDRTVSPSYVGDVVSATRRLLRLGAPDGLYHCVNSGQVTWLGLAEEVVRVLGRPARLVPVTTADVALRATRPTFCALSNSKLARAGVEMPSWQDAIRRFLEVRSMSWTSPVSRSGLGAR